MKPRLLLLGCLLLAGRTATGQDIKPKPADHERDRAVDTFQRLDGGNRQKPNEVTVILDDVPPPIPPPDKAAEPSDNKAAEPAPDKPAAADDSTGAPVLVTGKPPEDARLVNEEPPPAPEKPEKGVTVKVVDVQGGKGGGPIDPSQVKLLFPFTPKPLTPPPAGWTFDATAGAPPFTKQVELAPGTKIALNIRPHVLVPVADGKETFSVNEPGFDPALGYNQPGTVGTILSKSVAQLDEDSKNLGEAIDRLQQLLASLPAPAPAPEPAPPVATPVRDPAPFKKPR